MVRSAVFPVSLVSFSLGFDGAVRIYVFAVVPFSIIQLFLAFITGLSRQIHR
jgi:hypothetical protein